MSDDLVRRLRNTGSMSHSQVWETLEEAADRIEERDDIIRHDRERIEELVSMVNSKDDRIEELEAKLTKAVEALEEIAKPKVGPDFDWPDDEADRWRAGWYRKYGDNARTILAELKGETDE
jgi:DNA repair exonuclease SbcCD ATPase subunit